jgi:hypothetical protein
MVESEIGDHFETHTVAVTHTHGLENLGLVADAVDQRQWLWIVRILSQSQSVSTNLWAARVLFCYDQW